TRLAPPRSQSQTRYAQARSRPVADGGDCGHRVEPEGTAPATPCHERIQGRSFPNDRLRHRPIHQHHVRRYPPPREFARAPATHLLDVYRPSAEPYDPGATSPSGNRDPDARVRLLGDRAWVRGRAEPVLWHGDRGPGRCRRAAQRPVLRVSLLASGLRRVPRVQLRPLLVSAVYPWQICEGSDSARTSSSAACSTTWADTRIPWTRTRSRSSSSPTPFLPSQFPWASVKHRRRHGGRWDHVGCRADKGRRRAEGTSTDNGVLYSNPRGQET
ncbi:hypothetical protein C8T65DRAFT_833818, partial [Cerioporus squamosus]